MHYSAGRPSQQGQTLQDSRIWVGHSMIGEKEESRGRINNVTSGLGDVM